MTTEAELLEVIRREPGEDAVLVYADWLLARGDVRGELIVLDHRDRSTPGGLQDPEALERLLELAAEHGFPWLRQEPESEPLCFEGGGSYPVQYDVEHGGHRYYLRYRWGHFSITVDDDEQVDLELDVEGDGSWTDEETSVILTVIDQHLRAGRPVPALVFPAGDAMRDHPAYRGGRYLVWALPRTFLLAAPRGRRHEACFDGRNRDRWYRLWERLRAAR